MTNTMTDSKPLEYYVFRYLADKFKNSGIDEIVGWYVQNFIFNNPGYLEWLIKEYHLPEHDILKLHKAICKLAEAQA